MADLEHVKRLRRSIDEWNQWRQQQPDSLPDLRKADLRGTNLSWASLGWTGLNNYADLVGVNLDDADLSEALLNDANLIDANLIRANLIRAHLDYANLWGADLSGAKLISSRLSNARLSGANLRDADLSDANLRDAELTNAEVSGADFTKAYFASTIFAKVDLSNVKGLETAIHYSPSIVDINSVTLPTDKYTRTHFLRGVGFTDTQIEYLPSLLTSRPIQYHSLFISYDHQDQAIAERLHADFRKHDIPCWFAPHELTPGDYYRHKIDEAINHHDKLVLILSEHSIKSQWVEKEVETALKREESMDMNRQVLFPIRLDDTVMTTSRRWISSLRYHRHIGDFTNWQDETAYQQAFTTLLKHLKVDNTPTG